MTNSFRLAHRYIDFVKAVDDRLQKWVPQPSPEDLKKLHQEVKDLEQKFANDKTGLGSLYSEHMKWAMHFNHVIWLTGAIILPLTAGSLGWNFRYGTPSHLNFGQLLIAFLGSTSLLIFWLVIGNFHRRLWQRSFYLCDIIERSWGYRDALSEASAIWSKPSSHLLAHFITTDTGFIARYSIVFGLVVIWILRLVIEIFSG